MGKNYRSPAKIARSIKRTIELKLAIFQDLYDLDITMDENSYDIIWNMKSDLSLKLKAGTEVIETRDCFNPKYKTLSFGEKFLEFQNMWEPSQNSFLFFSCVISHIKRNSSKCDHFCSQFAMPDCGALTCFLATNRWPD